MDLAELRSIANDQKRIDHFRELIAAGERPIAFVMTLGLGWHAGFVLDGHHELAAYAAQGVTLRARS